MSICLNLNRNCAVIGRRTILSTQRYFRTSDLSNQIQKFDSNKGNDGSDWGNGFKRIAISGALMMSCVCAFKYLKEESEEKEGYILKSLMPSIAAAVPTTTAVSNRSKFNFLADIVEMAAPAVVYIEIKDKRHVDYYSREPITVSNGSGFIVDSSGLILTNAHVVINKAHTFLVVKLHDGRQFEGRVESVDPQSDLATVRIKCKNLPTLKLGQSSELRTGEWVVAMGSPLALSNSVTAGVISSMRPSKELGLRDKNIDYIQTDAAITFGNSGGPLINLDGEAIGINSMKVTTGISFAIPIDYVSKFLDESKKHRREEFQPPTARRFLGITMLTLTYDILTELRQRIMSVPADIKSGVLVWKVILGSPAHVGGLHPGDIITHINGKQVSSTSDIYAILAEKGKPLDTIVQRGMEKLRLRIEPEEIEEE